MSTLFAHQREFIKQNPDKMSLIWSCGTGKSRAAVEWAKRGMGSVLIICPKALKRNWEREMKKWEADYKPHLVISKEEFRRYHKQIGAYQQVIVDEVHNGFLTPLFASQMSKALKDYLKTYEVPRVLLLTATPYTSSPWNIFNLGFYTGHKWNYKSYERTFFFKVPMGHRMVPMVKAGSEKKLATIVAKIANVVRIEDVMDVPEQNHCDPEYFSLTTEQRKAIVDNYDPQPIVRYTQQHEIENGVLLANEFRTGKFFPAYKNERILSLVEENPKVAIICRYNMQIDDLQHMIMKVVDPKDVYVIRGDVKDRDGVTQQAEKAERAVVIIQADCAEGYNLPSFGLCIFASMSYAYTKWEQMCGRFLRMDKPSPTTFIYLLTDGDSVDKAVYNAVKKKEDFKIELYARHMEERQKAAA